MALADVFLLIDRFGAERTVSRIDPPGPATSVSVPIVMRRSQEIPLMGDVSQADVQFYVRHTALTAKGYPVPPVKGDRVIDGLGRTFVVKTVEDMNDQSGDPGAYRLWARGH